MTIRLRHDVLPEDRDAVERITRSSGFFSEVEVGIALEVFDKLLNQADSGYEAVIAEQDERVCGYAIWGFDNQSVCSFELYWIAVDDEARGSGVGSLMLEDVEASVAARGGGTLYIETAGREQYGSTRRFYERRGYGMAACLEDYYAPGDARVIYSRRI